MLMLPSVFSFTSVQYQTQDKKTGQMWVGTAPPCFLHAAPD